jgi:hypothetical protein
VFYFGTQIDGNHTCSCSFIAPLLLKCNTYYRKRINEFRETGKLRSAEQLSSNKTSAGLQSVATRSSSPAPVGSTAAPSSSNPASAYRVVINASNSNNNSSSDSKVASPKLFSHVRSSSSNANNSGLPNSRPSLAPELAQNHLLNALIEANSIYSYYIDIGAPNELNLAASHRIQIRAVLDAIIMTAATANNIHLPSHASSPPLPLSISHGSSDIPTGATGDGVITRKGLSVSRQLTVDEAIDLELKVRSIYNGCLNIVIALLDANCFQRFRLSDSFRTLLDNLRGVTNHHGALTLGIGHTSERPTGIKGIPSVNKSHHRGSNSATVPLAINHSTASGRQLLTVPIHHPLPLPSSPVSLPRVIGASMTTIPSPMQAMPPMPGSVNSRTSNEAAPGGGTEANGTITTTTGMTGITTGVRRGSLDHVVVNSIVAPSNAHSYTGDPNFGRHHPSYLMPDNDSSSSLPLPGAPIPLSPLPTQ